MKRIEKVAAAGSSSAVFRSDHFRGGGTTREPGGNPGSRTKTNNKLNPHVTRQIGSKN